jgi:O-antigen/teichoic acid export membrane protein
MKHKSIRQFLVYALSVAGTMGTNLLLVLFLVHVLPSDVYSEIVLIKIAIIVTTTLAGMGLSQAAVRWHGISEDSDYVYSSVATGVLLMAIPGAVILIAIIMISTVTFYLNINAALLFSLVVLVVSYMLNNELINWARARHESLKHAITSTARGIASLCSVAAGVYLSGDANGFIYGLTAGELLFLLIAVNFGYNQKLVPVKKEYLLEMLKYGWPHTVVISSGFLLTYADRYMLAMYGSNISIVGYYDAAYMIVTSALALLVRPFNLLMFPSYMKKYSEQGDVVAINFIERSQRYFIAAATALAFALIMLRYFVLGILFPEEYLSSASIVAPVAYAVIINGVFMTAVAGLYISNKTLMVGVSAALALVVNIILNIILIPEYGMNGAAMSTVFAAIVQLLMGYVFARVILKVRLPTMELTVCGILLGMAYYLTV